MDAIFSWFQRVEKVQFMAIEDRALTFKAKKSFKVGSRPTISIAIPIPSGGAEDFKLPVTITKVRQVGPKAVVCTGLVPGAAKSVEHLRQILHGLDPNAGGVAASVDTVDDSDSMRRAPRFHWSIRVLSKDLPGFRAISLDFNRHGLKLSTEGAVEENKDITMMLEIETAKTREILCQGVVRWVKEIGRRKYEVGVEFTELDEVVAKELENFEEFLASRQSGDVAKRSIQDTQLFEGDAFGPGVDGMTVEKKEAEAEPTEDAAPKEREHPPGDKPGD
jgi:PilZ domain